jgi:hypothetical protein
VNVRETFYVLPYAVKEGRAATRDQMNVIPETDKITSVVGRTLIPLQTVDQSGLQLEAELVYARHLFSKSLLSANGCPNNLVNGQLDVLKEFLSVEFVLVQQHI